MTITTKDTFGKKRTYEVVSKIPANFMVWNIGEHMGHDEYIPLCELRDIENCAIREETLKAIKLDPSEVEILRKAAGYGVNSKQTAATTLRRQAKSVMQKTKKALAEKALPIFERITA